MGTKDKITEKEWYRRKIVEMVEGIDRVWILNLIMEFIETITKEG